MGGYDDLRELIKNDFNLSGKLISPGWESKEFIHCDFALKWQGKSKQRSIVVKDDQESYLTNGLKHYANKMVDENTCFESEDELVEHVVVEIIDQDENNTS
jgi:hypothetical protein